jgi:hypothetical protein
MPPTVLVHGFKISKAVLVHGNATGIEFYKFERDTKYGDFTGFQNEIDNEEVKLYRWHYINEKYSFLDTLNFLKFSQLYFEERKYCSNPKALENMHEYIKSAQPSILLGHSLGAFQIFNYLNNYDLPDSVKKVVFVQGAFPSHEEITNSKILEKIKTGSLTIQNYHSIYDQMLWIYTLAHFHTPGGLYGAKSKYIENIEFTRLGPGNPHLWTIKNREFAEMVLN